jgi:hypothetical protein
MANVNGDAACVLQVNVGTSRELEWQGRTIRGHCSCPRLFCRIGAGLALTR